MLILLQLLPLSLQEAAGMRMGERRRQQPLQPSRDQTSWRHYCQDRQLLQQKQSYLWRRVIHPAPLPLLPREAEVLGPPSVCT